MVQPDWTLDHLFQGWPVARQLFEPVMGFLLSLPSTQMEVKKTQVSFAAPTKFAWVWLPQTWLKRQPADSLLVSFELGYQIRDDRIKQAVEPQPGHWTHHVVVQNPAADFDSQVKDWLTQSYTQHQGKDLGLSGRHK